MKKLISIFVVTLSWSTLGYSESTGIPHYREVTSNLSRGGRPTCDDLAELSRQGFKTVINLENDYTAIDAEKKCAAQLGLTEKVYALSAGKRPTDQRVDAVLSDLQNEKLFPIFIHCKHGQDRTGLLVGLYRVEVQKWSAKEAYREMLEIGYHPKYEALDRYFRDRTEYYGLK